MSQIIHSEIEEQLRARARESGFEQIGFSKALPLEEQVLHLKKWLVQGYGGTMTWLNRSVGRRSDPRMVLPGAQTIITVAQSYFSARLPDEIRQDPSRGIIASYAWGQDYHEVLLAKLQELAAYVAELAPTAETKCYVDTGPILERDYGRTAGLGFRGKNTLLISPKFGSTFFLGEILTTLDLPATPPPVMPSCGSCTRCQEVCPTHAFPAAYVLNSTLCISYLTIEYRGMIPRELRAKLGNHIFGCDECQDCCPWNDRFASETQEAAYRAQLERQAPKLTDLAALSESDFKELFAGSPVLRPGYTGLLRNVAVALGNWPSEAALPPLRILLEHPSPLVRTHAAWAVGRNPAADAPDVLRHRLRDESDPTVLEEIRLSGSHFK